MTARMRTGTQKHAAAVGERLARAIPEPRVELDFENAWQLLIATILAAQSTDKMINQITPALFARFPDAAALAAADPGEVETLVKRSGFFRNKAKAIMKASQTLADDFDGVVPRDIDQLVTLPGVARKTANVVIGCAYGLASGFVVDTHVTRTSQRLGLTKEKTPKKIEPVLCKRFPKDTWVAASHRLVLHGRYVCQAKKPLCARCPLNEVCRERQAEPDDTPWEVRADREHRLVMSRGAEPG